MAITGYTGRDTVPYLFKTFYLPRLRGQYYNQNPVAARLKKKVSPDDFVGNQAAIAAQTGWSEAVGAGVAGDKLPDPYFDPYSQMLVDMARNRGRVRIDRLAIKASANDKGAYERVLGQTMKSMRENLVFDVSRQMVFGDGTGKLCLVNGAVGSGNAVFAVDNPGTRMLRANMSIAFYNGSSEEDAATTHRILTVDSTTQFTLAANTAANVTDNDAIYRKPVPGSSGVDTRNKEMMGLAGVLDDGTRVATFQGLGRTANPWLKCNVSSNGGTNRPLTLPLLDQASEMGADGSGTTGSDDGWSAVYSKHGPRRVYADLCRTDRRYVNTLKFDGGWTALEYQGKPWIADRMCRDNEIWFTCEDDLGYWILSPLDWVDDDGAVVSRRADYDELEAYLVEYAQIGSYRCNRHVNLKDVSET